MSLHRDPFPTERFDNDNDFKGPQTPNVRIFTVLILYSFIAKLSYFNLLNKGN